LREIEHAVEGTGASVGAAEPLQPEHIFDEAQAAGDFVLPVRKYRPPSRTTKIDDEGMRKPYVTRRWWYIGCMRWPKFLRRPPILRKIRVEGPQRPPRVSDDDDDGLAAAGVPRKPKPRPVSGAAAKRVPEPAEQR